MLGKMFDENKTSANINRTKYIGATSPNMGCSTFQRCWQTEGEAGALEPAVGC